jgi:hypothetical protein
VDTGQYGALGTQVDVALTLAVAAAMTPGQRREWHDAEGQMRCTPARDIDTEWRAHLLAEHYPELDPDAGYCEVLADETAAATDYTDIT